MAVVNRWADALVEAGKKTDALNAAMGELAVMSVTLETVATESNTSIYKLARIPSNWVPLKVEIHSDAITGATSYALGFYEEDGTTVVDVDELMAATDIHAGNAIGSPLDGMSAVGIANLGKKVWELLGKTINNKAESYVLALTAAVVGTAAGTINVTAYFAKG